MLKNLFSVVVWGEKYSSYLCDISIPTLLTSYNLALLKPNTGNTFLIVTTSRDQNIIEKHESIKNLKKLLDVKFEIIKKPHQSFFENKNSFSKKPLNLEAFWGELFCPHRRGHETP